MDYFEEVLSDPNLVSESTFHSTVKTLHEGTKVTRIYDEPHTGDAWREAEVRHFHICRSAHVLMSSIHRASFPRTSLALYSTSTRLITSGWTKVRYPGVCRCIQPSCARPGSPAAYATASGLVAAT
jgi:hypothetical protein